MTTARSRLYSDEVNLDAVFTPKKSLKLENVTLILMLKSGLSDCPTRIIVPRTLSHLKKPLAFGLVPFNFETALPPLHIHRFEEHFILPTICHESSIPRLDLKESGGNRMDTSEIVCTKCQPPSGVEIP